MDYNHFYGTVVTPSGQIKYGTPLTSVMSAITHRAVVQSTPKLIKTVSAPATDGDESMIRDKYRKLINTDDQSVPNAQDRALSSNPSRVNTSNSQQSVTGLGKYRFTPSSRR
jgi:hypothetical protein